MPEITLELGKAYFLDRVQELSHEVDHGTPFIFISGINLMFALACHSQEIELEYFIKKYCPSLAEVAPQLNDIRDSLTNYYSLKTYEEVKIALTHENDKHLKMFTVPSGEKKVDLIAIAAEPFVASIKEAVENLFKAAETDKVLAAELYVSLNRNKPVGYGL